MEKCQRVCNSFLLQSSLNILERDLLILVSFGENIKGKCGNEGKHPSTHQFVQSSSKGSPPDRLNNHNRSTELQQLPTSQLIKTIMQGNEKGAKSTSLFNSHFSVLLLLQARELLITSWVFPLLQVLQSDEQINQVTHVHCERGSVK